MKNFLIDDINVRWMSSKVKARSKRFFYTDSGGGSMAILTLEHVGKQYTSKWKGGHTVALEGGRGTLRSSQLCERVRI